MSTNNVQSPASSPPPRAGSALPPQQGSSTRLLVLLGLLAVAIGALAFDFFVAGPGAKAADDKIQKFVDDRNKMSVKDAAVVTSKDIRELLGMTPTAIEQHPEDNYEIEYYCWWGPVPVLNTRRQYISVVYYGSKEPRRFSSHHRNERPPEEALPIPPQPSGGKGDSETVAGPDNAAPAEADAPAEGDAKAEGSAKAEGDAKTESDVPAKAPEEGKAPAETKAADEVKAPAEAKAAEEGKAPAEEPAAKAP